MTNRRFLLSMIAVGIAWALTLTILVAVVGVRAEDTRDDLQISSACIRASKPGATPTDVAACVASDRAGLLNRTVADDCIIMRRTLRHRWYIKATRCDELATITTANGDSRK